MCPGREIGKGMVFCLECRKPVDPFDEVKGDGACHCEGQKVRYEGKGNWSEWSHDKN